MVNEQLAKLTKKRHVRKEEVHYSVFGPASPIRTRNAVRRLELTDLNTEATYASMVFRNRILTSTDGWCVVPCVLLDCR